MLLKVSILWTLTLKTLCSNFQHSLMQSEFNNLRFQKWSWMIFSFKTSTLLRTLYLKFSKCWRKSKKTSISSIKIWSQSKRIQNKSSRLRRKFWRTFMHWRKMMCQIKVNQILCLKDYEYLSIEQFWFRIWDQNLSPRKLKETK